MSTLGFNVASFAEPDSEGESPVWTWIMMIVAASMIPILLVTCFASLDVIAFSVLLGAWVIAELVIFHGYNNKRSTLKDKINNKLIKKEDRDIQASSLKYAKDLSNEGRKAAELRSTLTSILGVALGILGAATGIASVLCPIPIFSAFTCPFVLPCASGAAALVGSNDTIENPADHLQNEKITGQNTLACTIELPEEKLNTLISKLPATQQKKISPFVKKLISLIKSATIPEAMAEENSDHLVNNILTPLGIGAAGVAVFFLLRRIVQPVIAGLFSTGGSRASFYIALGIITLIAAAEMRRFACLLGKDYCEYNRLYSALIEKVGDETGLGDGAEQGGLAGDSNTTPGNPDLQNPTSPSNFATSSGGTDIPPLCISVDKKGGFKRDPKCSCKPNCYKGRTAKFKSKKGHWSYNPLGNVNTVVEAYRKHAEDAANGNLEGLQGNHDDLINKTSKAASSLKNYEDKLNKDLKKHGKKPISFKKSAADKFAKLKAAYKKGSDSIPQDKKGTFDIFGNFKPLSAGLGGKHAGASQKKGKGADAANSQSGKNAAGSGVGGVNNSGESEGTAYSWLKDKITGKNNAGNKNQADGSSQNNGKSNADSDGSNSDGSNGSNNDKDGQEVDSKWDKEDIVHRPEKSIFKIVSKRYFRSAYPVLLDISIFKKTGQ